jgi:hypothetical protein
MSIHMFQRRQTAAQRPDVALVAHPVCGASTVPSVPYGPVEAQLIRPVERPSADPAANTDVSQR